MEIDDKTDEMVCLLKDILDTTSSMTSRATNMNELSSPEKMDKYIKFLMENGSNEKLKDNLEKDLISFIDYYTNQSKDLRKLIHDVDYLNDKNFFDLEDSILIEEMKRTHNNFICTAKEDLSKIKEIINLIEKIIEDL